MAATPTAAPDRFGFPTARAHKRLRKATTPHACPGCGETVALITAAGGSPKFSNPRFGRAPGGNWQRTAGRRTWVPDFTVRGLDGKPHACKPKEPAGGVLDIVQALVRRAPVRRTVTVLVPADVIVEHGPGGVIGAVERRDTDGP